MCCAFEIGGEILGEIRAISSHEGRQSYRGEEDRGHPVGWTC